MLSLGYRKFQTNAPLATYDKRFPCGSRFPSGSSAIGICHWHLQRVTLEITMPLAKVFCPCGAKSFLPMWCKMSLPMWRKQRDLQTELQTDLQHVLCACGTQSYRQRYNLFHAKVAQLCFVSVCLMCVVSCFGLFVFVCV